MLLNLRLARRTFALLVVCLYCFGPVHGVQTAEPSLLDILPSDTLFYLRADEYRVANARVRRSSLGQLWSDPLLRPIRDDIENEGLQSPSQVIRENYGIDLALLDQLATGEFVVAAFETGERSLSLTFFVETDGQEASERLMRQVSERLIADGAIRQSESFPVGAELYQLPDSNDELILCSRDERFMVSGDATVARRILKRWSEVEVEGLVGLRQHPPFQRVTQVPEPIPADVIWYLDPIRLAVVGETASASQESSDTSDSDSTELPPFAMRHGFPGLKAIGGKIWLADPESAREFHAHVTFHAPSPREQALQMFDFPAASAQPAGFVPGHVGVWTGLSWRLPAVIENLGDVWDDVTDAPGAFQGTLDDVRLELKVDLVDLFDKLGPEIQSFGVYDEQQEIEGTVFSVAIQNAPRNERRVAAAIHRLLVEDTETIRRRVAGQRYDLWQVGLTVGDGKVPFSGAGVMVANGRLWLSTHASLIQNALQPRSHQPLAGQPDFERVKQYLDQLATPRDFGRMFVRTHADIRYTYQVLRNQGIAGLNTAENTYSALLLKVLEKVGQDLAIDFSKLPELDSIREYLGTAGVVARNTDHGWELEAHSFEP